MRQKGFSLIIILLILAVAVGAYFLKSKKVSDDGYIIGVDELRNVFLFKKPSKQDNNKPLPDTLPNLGEDDSVHWKASCKSILNNPKTEYKECGMEGGFESADDKKMCEEIGGQYVSCVSPCRHDPSGPICAQVCVAICKFE